MKTLKVIIKKKYFDLIVSGEKKEEYREVKPFWISRLSKKYDKIKLTNGYNKNSPFVVCEMIDVEIKEVYFEITNETKYVFAIKLGEILEKSLREDSQLKMNI